MARVAGDRDWIPQSENFESQVLDDVVDVVDVVGMQRRAEVC
jgi:hypothetical protein